MDARKGEIGLLDVEAATLRRMSRQLLSMQLHLRLGLGLGVIVCSGCCSREVVYFSKIF